MPKSPTRQLPSSVPPDVARSLPDSVNSSAATGYGAGRKAVQLGDGGLLFPPIQYDRSRSTLFAAAAASGGRTKTSASGFGVKNSGFNNSGFNSGFNSEPYTNARVARLGPPRVNPAADVAPEESHPSHSSSPTPSQVNMLGPSKPRVTSQSAEFATRFAHRPSTRPKVIGLDSETMIPRPQGNKGVSRGIGGFFPPVKLRMAPGEPSLPPGHAHRTAKSPSLMLELAPEQRISPDHWSTRTAPARYLSNKNTSSSHNRSSSSNGPAPGSASAPKLYPYVPNTGGGVDLCDLPRPQLLVSRDTPWVYRYKVKKNMNELSRIMASKSEATDDSALVHS